MFGFFYARTRNLINYYITASLAELKLLKKDLAILALLHKCFKDLQYLKIKHCSRKLYPYQGKNILYPSKLHVQKNYNTTHDRPLHREFINTLRLLFMYPAFHVTAIYCFLIGNNFAGKKQLPLGILIPIEFERNSQL